MTLFSFRSFAAAATFVVLAGIVHAQTAIISKARAYLGPEAALDAVKTVHYKGTLVATDPVDATKETKAQIDIIFQKPEQQRLTLTTDKAIEVTGLNGYDAWQRVTDVKDPSKWKQSLASTTQIKSMRANTWENVSFFRGIETRGGRLEVMGPGTVDGVACQKVAFIHGPNLVFIRYFDEATGKLMLTETEAGSTIREEGEQMVNGIRYPKKIINKSKNAAGKESVVTINFEEIKLNETFPSSMFAIPSLERK
jgi:hypothetical protein